MDQIDENGLTRRKNERKVNKFLDTELWVGETRQPIRVAGKEAVDRRNPYGYESVKFICDAMNDFELDDFQKRIVFDELKWLFMCKTCNVGKEASRFKSPNPFDIKVQKDFISLESLDACKKCRRG